MKVLPWIMQPKRRNCVTKYVVIKHFQISTLMYLNVSKDIRPLFANITEGKRVWEVIQKYFNPKSRAHTIGLLDQFFSYKIGTNKKFCLYASRLRKIIADLLDCGEKIALKYQAFQVIRFLPD
ncbi:hypothetical protein AVEN_271050-1 [Araneus ventricosus]|uniref:Uncharacterized protein n=1 Tax=Araneus ventricosus TaxID=182803 RepID=A0A4Y2FEL9_ARAVE|nr:hypothetical protein AVEN_271050-1 [Araneus ventricosus]